MSNNSCEGKDLLFQLVKEMHEKQQQNNHSPNAIVGEILNIAESKRVLL